MSATYEKEYFRDDYSKQFEFLRACYRERTQRAINGRSVDHAPVPNATTIVFLHDDDEGNTEISTGDFVEYFNRCYGGGDRIGAMRASLVSAVKKAEKSNEYAKQKRSEKTRSKRKTGIANRVRTAGRRLVFSHVLFAAMLLLSLTILFGSSVILDRADARTVALENQLAARESEQIETVDGAKTAVYLGRVGEDTVEICTAEEEQSHALFAWIGGLIRSGR